MTHPFSLSPYLQDTLVLAGVYYTQSAAERYYNTLPASQIAAPLKVAAITK